MTDYMRILAYELTEGLLPGEEMAICGSIQNYRRIQRKMGRYLSEADARREWKEKVFDEIVSLLRNDRVISIATGSNIAEFFFPVLYQIENNNYRIDRNEIRALILRKAHGFRAFLSKLIA